MCELNKQDTEDLALIEHRDVRLPEGAIVEIIATRHHWLVVEECYGYGWSLEEMTQLALIESQETGRSLSLCFCYVLAYIQADARHVLAIDSEASFLPLLPNAYEPREVA